MQSAAELGAEIKGKSNEKVEGKIEHNPRRHGTKQKWYLSIFIPHRPFFFFFIGPTLQIEHADLFTIRGHPDSTQKTHI